MINFQFKQFVLAAAGWLNLNYATFNLHLMKTWGIILHTYRQNRLSVLNPSMEDLISLMHQASVVASEKKSLFSAF